MPPSDVNAAPAACTLMTRLAMLNSVRYSGFFVVIRNVHWLQALIDADDHRLGRAEQDQREKIDGVGNRHRRDAARRAAD